MLGINPHSGDNGVIGNEDDTILKPALELAKQSGKLIYVRLSFLKDEIIKVNY